MKDRWIKHFMKEVYETAKLSKDPKTQCAALIVGRHNEIISKGFNGYPIGWSDEPMRNIESRRERQGGVVHAEINALVFANPIRLEGASIFVSKTPCTQCAAVISQYRAIYGGPARIYCPELAVDSQWSADYEYMSGELQKSSIELIIVQ